jgi:hypothetical protein
LGLIYNLFLTAVKVASEYKHPEVKYWFKGLLPQALDLLHFVLLFVVDNVFWRLLFFNDKLMERLRDFINNCSSLGELWSRAL